MTDGTMVPERAGILDGSTIGERLRSARRERIVGREAEVALLREAVHGGEQRFAVLFVHGPGGVGKTTLLRRFEDVAGEAESGANLPAPGASSPPRRSDCP